MFQGACGIQPPTVPQLQYTHTNKASKASLAAAKISRLPNETLRYVIEYYSLVECQYWQILLREGFYPTGGAVRTHNMGNITLIL